MKEQSPVYARPSDVEWNEILEEGTSTIALINISLGDLPRKPIVNEVRKVLPGKGAVCEDRPFEQAAQ